MNKLIISTISVLAILLLWAIASIYPDWLWFDSLEFSSIFRTMLLSKFGFGAAVWLVLLIFIFANAYMAKRLNQPHLQRLSTGGERGFFSQLGLSKSALNSLLIIFILVLSVVIGSKGAAHWDTFLRYVYQQPFGATDPIFDKDIAFYVFSLPFYLLIRGGLLLFVILGGVLAICWYLKDGALRIIEEISRAQNEPPVFPKLSITSNAKKHLIFLGGVIALLVAWGYYLKVYGLLYSTQGPAFGASYTDIHVKIWVYKLLSIASIGLAVVLFINAFRTNIRHIWIGIGMWVGVVLVFSAFIPFFVQKLVVKPNELAKESQYITHNIDFTRKAYNLNRIKEVDFQVKDQLSPLDVERQHVTIKNIRIWDERPLLQTYRQLQAIRLYYDFNNVDVDRYIINQEYRQIMLAARELLVSQLPPQARTWVNRHLTYTHGYGLAASPVNEVSEEGLPNLLIKDLPPSFVPDLKIDRPEIYYGEKTNEYVLVKAKTKEFDYPKGDKNVYTTYEGNGGVSLGSFMRRLFFAFEFIDPQIMFTTYLGPESRIMYNRRIDMRVRSIAPFLDYDSDPYLVLSEGRLYWILDAYTTSNMYPYSVRSVARFNKTINYIRNSVKVVIDAYNGKVQFYMMDESDPVVKTYAKIFPKLFTPFQKMPDDLKRHIRYPKDLFQIQAGTYRAYHMEDAQVFYNQEDLWQTPDEMYSNRRQVMEPYYIIIKLPEAEREEFLLMLPFTPSKKDNMIGWLAARSDVPYYGDLLVYKLPKEKLVYGPMQIEARVDQQTEISRELSLWDQRGSRVIRGNLLAIPISETFIYVEPVYLEAKQEEKEVSTVGSTPRIGFRQPQRSRRPLAPRSDISTAAALPELKRVIVAFGNRVLMDENLDKALSGILEGRISIEEMEVPTMVSKQESQDIYALGRSALEHYQRAKSHLKQGNWAAYGRELDQMEKILKEISKKKQ